MAAKKIRQPTNSAVAERHVRRKFGRIVWPAAVIAAVAVGGILFYGHRTSAALPPIPDFSAKSGLLQQAVRDAVAKASAWTKPLDGVADLGRLYHVNGYEREAAACWELLSRKQPGEGRWPYYLSDLARTTNDGEGMIAHLREALRREPAYATGWLRLADIDFKNARFDEADALYRRRLALVPGDPFARLGLARIALQLGRQDEGRRALAELVRDVPDFPSAQNIFSELLAREGDESAAARYRLLGMAANRFREADDPWLLELRSYCFDSHQLAIWASQEEQTKHPDRARSLFERAMAVVPDDPLPYAEFGQLLLDAGEREKAHEVLARGFRLASFNEKLVLRFSVALRELGKAQEAIENDQRALARVPDSVEFLDSLGQSQLALGRYAEAEQSFRAALQRSPNSVGPLINLGIMYHKSARRDEARRIWEAALAANPGYAKLLALLGRLALEDRRFDDAERLIRPYFQQHPGNSQSRSLYAQLHLLRAVAAQDAHDLAAAEQWCTAGLADVPDAFELLGLLGNIHLQNGRVAPALQAMEACLRLRPGDPRAVLPLANLYMELKRPADARRVLTDARDWLKQKGGANATKPIEEMLRKIPEG